MKTLSLVQAERCGTVTLRTKDPRCAVERSRGEDALGPTSVPQEGLGR